MSPYRNVPFEGDAEQHPEDSNKVASDIGEADNRGDQPAEKRPAGEPTKYRRNDFPTRRIRIAADPIPDDICD